MISQYLSVSLVWLLVWFFSQLSCVFDQVQQSLLLYQSIVEVDAISVDAVRGYSQYNLIKTCPSIPRNQQVFVTKPSAWLTYLVVYVAIGGAVVLGYVAYVVVMFVISR